MTALALVLVPTLASLALTIPALRARAGVVLLLAALATAALALLQLLAPSPGPVLFGYGQVDPTARLFLALVDPIFLGISVYAWNRVTATPSLAPELGRFACLGLAFLAACNTVLLADHLLVLWIALEASTLCAAPLVLRPGSPSSRGASWRYLLFSSVGLGLALLGFLCLARGMELGGRGTSFALARLPELAGGAAEPWQPLGVALVLLGLGAKLGLAPMYGWLPETYDEAPPAVTSLLGAVQFNCTLVVLFRIVHVYRPEHTALVEGALVTMGIVSMVVSTFSIIATRNVKRLIAYASINHAGVIAIGLGVGKTASYGLLLYVISNAFIKAILFLTVGKIKAHYGTKDTRHIAGLIEDLPYSGVFLMVGTFALLGFPPFGSFIGELLILSALVSSGQMLVFAAFCVLITMTFVATGRTIFPMIWGAPEVKRVWPRQTFLSSGPKLAFFVALVVLGVYIPPALDQLIRQVAVSLEGP